VDQEIRNSITCSPLSESCRVIASRVQGAIDWHRAARYVADVGEGLLRVHSLGIVHRDIKPANILWDPGSDEALLTDFGIAALLASKGGVAGTLPYMAPEAFAGQVSPALDVYSLAVTLYQLVTGSVPFAGPDTSAYLDRVSPIPTHSADRSPRPWNASSAPSCRPIRYADPGFATSTPT
jgi:serine/threonine-protein kinase